MTNMKTVDPGQNPDHEVEETERGFDGFEAGKDKAPVKKLAMRELL